LGCGPRLLLGVSPYARANEPPELLTRCSKSSSESKAYGVAEVSLQLTLLVQGLACTPRYARSQLLDLKEGSFASAMSYNNSSSF
jgi:hypothetical protein